MPAITIRRRYGLATVGRVVFAVPEPGRPELRRTLNGNHHETRRKGRI